MLRENDRFCDVCGFVIPKGTKYRVSVVPETNALLFASSFAGSDPDLLPTTTVDRSGNIRLDICLECHLSMGQQGTEHVN